MSWAKPSEQSIATGRPSLPPCPVSYWLDIPPLEAVGNVALPLPLIQMNGGGRLRNGVLLKNVLHWASQLLRGTLNVDQGDLCLFCEVWECRIARVVVAKDQLIIFFRQRQRDIIVWQRDIKQALSMHLQQYIWRESDKEASTSLVMYSERTTFYLFFLKKILCNQCLQ